MPNRPHFASVQVTSPVSESGVNTETVVSTLTGVIPEVASQAIKLSAAVFCQLVATTATVTLRIRRVNLTGTLCGVAYVYVATAGTTLQPLLTIAVEDTPGEGNLTYVLTYQGSGEAGVSNVQASEFTARWD